MTASTPSDDETLLKELREMNAQLRTIHAMLDRQGVPDWVPKLVLVKGGSDDER